MKKREERKLPLKPIQRCLKNEIYWQVEQNVYEYIEKQLRDTIQQYADAVSKEFIERNKIRKLHNQPEFRRIPENLFKHFSVKVYKNNNDFENGDIGHQNRETMFSQASEVT
jgi:hypothetical protein